MPQALLAVRPAAADDFWAIERVAAANEEPTVSSGWPGFFYLEHLQRAATLLVAEVDGAVVGFGGAAVVGGARPAAHITDLFVDPAFHGQGAGGQLLRGLLEAVAVPDWHTCSSAEPRAMTLYARAGLQPRWPVCYLAGPVTGEGLAPHPGATTMSVTPEAAAAREASWSGRDLGLQYRHWVARPPGGTTFELAIAGRTVAVGTARDGRFGPGRVLDHLAIAPEADPVEVILAAVASGAVRGAASEPAMTLKLAVPGPSPALLPLLARGFVITDHDTFCATRPDLIDPARIVMDPSFG